MLAKLDEFLNKLTMYQLVLWGLRALFALTVILSLVGVLDISTLSLLLSAAILLLVGYGANLLFSRAYNVPANHESYAITLLIMYCILPPAVTLERGLLLAAAAVIAIASKFLITYHGKHIFNPAAFAPFMLGILGLMHASWWIGSSVLWPFTLVIGLLVVRKLRRFSLFLSFVAVSLLTLLISVITSGDNITEALRFYITSSPLIFLAAFMLTEPATMPAHRKQQMIFGGLIGFLYAMPWNLGPLTVYPETALLIGNLYAFAVSPRYRLRLQLKEVQQVSERVYNFVFMPGRRFSFVPGQYIEWTLPHAHIDARGNRRSFSLASSPTEPDVIMGVKFTEPMSSYKKALKAMKRGDSIYAGQIAGDFTLPIDSREKLVFIAGGIGITPFRSMLKYIIDKNQQSDIVLLYAVSDPHEVAYKDVLEKAAAHGVQAVTLLTSGTAPANWQGSVSKLSGTVITELVPDYKQRTFYISGPNAMVKATKAALHGVGVRKIRTDYFSGY